MGESMLSIKECRELLGKSSENLTDEQIEQLCVFLIRMGKLNVQIINQQKNQRDETGNDNVQGKLG